MSRTFFDQLEIPNPNYNLGVGSGLHGEQTSRMLKSLEPILIEENPDLVVLYGDTNSTLAGAICASKLDIEIGHVEAGLRSFNQKMPEEINRVLTDHCSLYLFCPTETAVTNLFKEGITEGVHLTGDVMCDVLVNNIPIANEQSGIIERLELEPSTYHLLTLHRPQNVDNQAKLMEILSALREIKTQIVWPIHPRAKKMLDENKDSLIIPKNIKIVKPLPYIDFLCLENYSDFILTDSGGIQKEAYMLKKPCVTLRDETEWVETVTEGWNILTGTDKKKIVSAINSFKMPSTHSSFYGTGNATEKILEVITT